MLSPAARALIELIAAEMADELLRAVDERQPQILIDSGSNKTPESQEAAPQ